MELISAVFLLQPGSANLQATGQASSVQNCYEGKDGSAVVSLGRVGRQLLLLFFLLLLLSFKCMQKSSGYILASISKSI